MLDKLNAGARGAQQSMIRRLTAEVVKSKGVDLSQGLCTFLPDQRILDGAVRAVLAGKNTYSPNVGAHDLRQQLADKYRRRNGLDVTIDNVMVTSGATGAFESICKTFLEPGDEVVMVQPFYGYHIRQVQDRGAIPRFVSLHPPDWHFDREEFENALTDKTKFVVFSNPSNPTGKVFTREELEFIGQACRSRGILTVVDEVYEYILADDKEHVSMASLPGMFESTITMSSASKTLCVTGWRIGWLVAPAEVIPALGVKFDDAFMCAPRPFQHAVSDVFALGDEIFEQIRQIFCGKRDTMAAALRGFGLDVYGGEGACYLIAGYEKLGFKDDMEAIWSLLENQNIAGLPGSSFYPGERDSGFVRFCFAVSDEDLERVTEALAR